MHSVETVNDTNRITSADQKGGTAFSSVDVIYPNNTTETNESQDKNSQRNTLSEAALLNDKMEEREKERMAADVLRLNSLNRFVHNAFKYGKIKQIPADFSAGKTFSL